MPKNEFARSWKVRSVDGEPYSHQEERIKIEIDDNKVATFFVRPASPEPQSWGALEDMKAFYIPGQGDNPGQISGSFLYKGTLHVYTLTTTKSHGPRALACTVDDADGAPDQALGPLQPGAWVAEDDVPGD